MEFIHSWKNSNLRNLKEDFQFRWLATHMDIRDTENNV